MILEQLLHHNAGVPERGLRGWTQDPVAKGLRGFESHPLHKKLKK